MASTRKSPGLDKRNQGRNRGVAGKGGTEWKMAATSLHDNVLFDTETVASKRPIALMPTLIRWWEAFRAPQVAKWQHKYRVDWDATDGRNGGAQRTLWEVLMEMERFKHRAGEEDQGAVALVLGFRAVCLWSGRGRRTSASRGRSCGCCVGISSTRGECSSQDVWRSRSGPSRPSCQGQSGVAYFCVLYCRMR